MMHPCLLSVFYWCLFVGFSNSILNWAEPSSCISAVSAGQFCYLFSFGVFHFVMGLSWVCNSLQESRAVGVFSANTVHEVSRCSCAEEGEMQMFGSEVSARRRDMIFHLHRFLKGHLPDIDGRGLPSN